MNGPAQWGWARHSFDNPAAVEAASANLVAGGVMENEFACGATFAPVFLSKIGRILIQLAAYFFEWLLADLCELPGYTEEVVSFIKCRFAEVFRKK
jgi:hypothetical protein